MKQLDLFEEIIVDNFAGGGGASTGIELATGRPVTIAINHDPDAILMHQTNHQYTTHYQESVWDINPEKVCMGRPVGLAWFSPDCKHFSKAKGSKPVDRHIRGLAWIVLRWAGTVRPRVIILENVEEFQTWGPVRKGKPVKAKAGQSRDNRASALAVSEPAAEKADWQGRCDNPLLLPGQAPERPGQLQRQVPAGRAYKGGASLRASGWKCVGKAGGLRWTGKRRPEVDLCPAQMKIRFEKEG